MSNVYYYRPMSPESRDAAEKLREDFAKAQGTVHQHMIEQRERQKAKPKRTPPVAGVRQYLATEAKHAVRGPAPAEVVEQRIRLCMECPGRVDVYQGVKDDGGVGFCTQCGCPANQRSKLSVKLTLAGVTCPLSKFGPVEGTGGSAATAFEAAKGVVSSVVAQLRKII
jgi:hypothetical protein